MLLSSHLAASVLAALAGPGAEGDLDLFHTGISHIHGIVMTLAAVPDDDDLLLCGEIDVGVPIITNAHFNFPFQGARLAASCLHDRDVDRRA